MDAQPSTAPCLDPAVVERAREPGAASDVVAVVGDQIEVVGEGRSTATLELLGGQVGLLEAVASAEVVQAYVRDRVTSASWADLELSAFTHIDLVPGRVEVAIPVADCTIVDAEGRRVVEPGELDVLLGPCSRADSLLAARFVVTRPEPDRAGR